MVLIIILHSCICFLISDFLDNDFELPLKIANKKHDVISVKIDDLREKELPKIGLIQFQDAETNSLKWVDTNNKLVRENYKKNQIEKNLKTDQIFKSCGVDSIQISTNEDYVKPLINFFKKRM